MDSVRKSIIVKASPERAFRVFTEGIDTWWPRGHHIGATPMKRTVAETRSGGRLYSEHEDGTEQDWGKVLVWEPPKRVVWAWQVNPQWKYESDLAKASEVEITFTPQAGGQTRVDLNHQYWERHGEGVEAMREGVAGDGGWNGMLKLFAAAAEANEKVPV